jgi:hypothetical protein
MHLRRKASPSCGSALLAFAAPRSIAIFPSSFQRNNKAALAFRDRTQEHIANNSQDGMTRSIFVDDDSAGHINNDEEQSGDFGCSHSSVSSSQETAESTLPLEVADVETDEAESYDDEDLASFEDFESSLTQAIQSCRRDSLRLKKYQGRRLAQEG